MDEITNLLRIKQYFREYFTQFYNNNKDVIIERIDEVIESEIDFISTEEGIDYADELKYNIEEINKGIRIDVENYLNKIEEIIENNPYLHEPDDDLEHYSQKSYDELSEDRIISNMFD
ncbi:unnamed protein product, partial [marine sediment metagenome]